MKRFAKLSVVCSMFLFLFVGISCSVEEASEDRVMLNKNKNAYQVTESKTNKALAISQKNLPKNQMLVWSATMRMQVKDIDQTGQEIESIVSDKDAYIATMLREKKHGSIENTYRIRVHSSAFDSLLSQIQKQGYPIENFQVHSKEVGEEYIDLSQRLKSKELVLERYRSLLKKNTGSITEILEVEEKMREITEEIEAKKGRLRYLEDQVSYSTITIHLFQKVPYQEEVARVEEKPFGKKIVSALQGGLDILSSLFLGLMHIWPILLLVILLLWKRKTFFK